MKFGGRRGFTLAEFLIAIVFVGIVLGPLLAFVARIADLNSAIGQQARREAARSFADQAVAVGIPASEASALQSAVNAAAPNVVAPAVNRLAVTTPTGVAAIVPLQSLVDGTVSEPRVASSGYQIGAGGALPPRSAPALPLAPIVMPAPVVTPTDGAVIDVAELTPAAPNAPYNLAVNAAASGPALVHATLDSPHGTYAAAGTAQFSVTAADLANGVSGTAWSEYTGDATAGDRAVALDDGRTRWLVTTSENRLQIYEPSPKVRFAYQIDLGSPVLVVGPTAVNASETIPIDYAAYASVQGGASSLRVDFPDEVKGVFGSAWASLSVGFRWTFNGTAGAFDGNAAAFFQPGALSAWTDTVAVVADPVVPTGAVATAGNWTITRVKTVLAVPQLVTTAPTMGVFNAGDIEFAAPPGPDGTAIGRLSFDHGSVLSTGASLTLSVIP